jgi:hypothetical protein
MWLRLGVHLHAQVQVLKTLAFVQRQFHGVTLLVPLVGFITFTQ